MVCKSYSVSVCSVIQLCPTLGNPLDCSPPESSICGIFQARILEWVDIPFSGRFSWFRDWTCISCIGRWILYHRATWEAPFFMLLNLYSSLSSTLLSENYCNDKYNIFVIIYNINEQYNIEQNKQTKKVTYMFSPHSLSTLPQKQLNSVGKNTIGRLITYKNSCYE